MRTSAISLACLSLLAFLLLSLPAAAQNAAPLAGGVVNSGPGREVVVARPVGSFADSAVASCAGGAAIGYLIVVATGGTTPFGTAAMFCGLSVAATAASTVAVLTWRTITSPF